MVRDRRMTIQGVGDYSRRNAAGTERQAVAAVTRQEARDFLASLATTDERQDNKR